MAAENFCRLADNADQKGHKELMGLKWKCCPGCWRGRRTAQRTAQREQEERVAAAQHRGQGDRALLGLLPGLGSPHMPSLFHFPFVLKLLSVNIWNFFCNQQHFLSQSRAFCDRGIPTVWDQPEKRGRFWLHFPSLFPIMWSVSEVSVMPHLTPLKNLKFLRGIEQVQGFTRNRVYLWDSKSYCTIQCWGHSDQV